MVREGRGSVSLLQRSLGIGYGRAARLIDFMAEDGIVGPYNGSQAREILLTLAQWEDMSGHGSAAAAAAPGTAKPRRNNKILMTPPDEKLADSDPVRTVKAVGDGEEAQEEEMDSYATEDDEPPFDEDPPKTKPRKTPAGNRTRRKTTGKKTRRKKKTKVPTNSKRTTQARK